MTQSSEAPTIEGWEDVDALPEPAESEAPEAAAEAPVDTDAATDADDASPADALGDDADQQDAETADADDAADASPDDPPAAEDTQHNEEPFTFRVDGTEVEVPGAKVAGDTIEIPRDAWNRVVQPRLADRSAWQRERQQYQRQIAELNERTDPERNPEVAKSRAVMQAFEALMQVPEDQLYDQIQALRQQWPVIAAKAEAEAYKRQAETLGTQATTQEAEALAREWTPKLQDGLRQGVAQVLGSDEYKGLGIDGAEIANGLWENPVLRRAAFGVAEEGDGTGLPPGTPYVDLEFLERHIRPFATAALRRVKAAQEAAEAKKRNAARLGKPAPAATVGVRGAEEAGGRSEKLPESKEEWERWVMRS